MLASVVIERILDTLMFAFLLAVSAFFFRTKINGAFGEVKLWGLNVSFEIATYLILLASVALLTAFAILSLYPEKIAGWAETVLAKRSKKWAERIANALRAFIEGTASLKNRAKYAEIVASSLVIWVLYLLGMLLPFYALSMQERYALGVMEALTTLSISGFGQLITPAGAGTYQYACQITLEKVFDVARVEASGFALITFALQTLTNASLGMIAFLAQAKEEAGVRAEQAIASEKPVA
ncbi:MAG: flippase-like domain-containing protein [Chloroherpetonaceae bacterium]|nr:flippase-like domain-containing protein [Chloroherpetonaceae bacterium]